MAGHSKWSKVKHIEGLLDAKRGAAFSKLVKEITVAARIGGGDPSGNPRLRSVVETARAVNMPMENIERADSQKHTYVPDNTASIGDGHTAARVLHLHEILEDHDDTQNVYSNFDISEDVLARLPA